MLGLDRLLQKSPGTIAQNLLQGVIPVWCIECNDITITQAVYSSVGCDPARSSNKIHRSPLSSYTRNDHISQRAAQGDGEAMYQVGVRALGWKQLVPFYNAYTRIEWMKKAINHNYPKAVAELYYMHEKLWGDESERITWLRIAAEKGDPWAQNMMSKFADSREERLAWNQKAVEQRYSEAIFSLAFSYEHGRDVEKDLSKAAFYYSILSYNSTARMACSDIFKVLPEQEKEQVSAQVKDWLEHNTVYYFTDPLFD